MNMKFRQLKFNNLISFTSTVVKKGDIFEQVFEA